MLILELAIIAALIVLNGLLAMSELAIVSSRPARLRVMVDRDVTGSRRALVLASDPGRFLSTVQIGITLVGVLSGAFSGATLGLRLAWWLTEIGLGPVLAEAIGLGGVVAAITFAANHRRTGSQADRAPRSGSGGGQGRAGNDHARQNRFSACRTPERFGQSGAVAPRSPGAGGRKDH